MVCSALDIKRASPSSGCAASRAEAGGSSCWGNTKVLVLDSRERVFASERVTCHTRKKLYCDFLENSICLQHQGEAEFLGQGLEICLFCQPALGENKLVFMY